MRSLTTIEKIAAGALVVLLALCAVLMWKLHSAQGAEARAALAESQARARADTTRELRRVITAQGDTVRQFQRLSVQQAQKADAIDKQLDQMRRALLNLSVQVAHVDVRGVASTTPTIENALLVRQTSFELRREPYTLKFAVSLPPPPARGVLDSLSIDLDVIKLSGRLGCTNKVNALGMRDASLTVSGPTWATIAIEHVEQDPSVCPSPVLQRDLSADDRMRLAVVAGFGYTFPQPAARAFVGLAISKPLPCPALLRKRLPGC